MPRKHIVVSGRVQHVGFRNHTQLLAQAYHLTGWVRNLLNGNVEVVIQGAADNIEQFLIQLGKKSFLIRIDHMEIDNCQETIESGFTIK